MAKNHKDLLLDELQTVVSPEVYQELLQQAGDTDKLYRLITQAGISSFNTSTARKVAWHEFAAVMTLLFIGCLLLLPACGISGSTLESILLFWNWLGGHF